MRQIQTSTTWWLGDVLILVLYVDDLFLTGSLGLIEESKRDLAVDFEMKDLFLMHYFLGMEIWLTNGEIFLSQGKYCINIFWRFKIEDCRAMYIPMITNRRKIDASWEKEIDPTLYKQLIGSLMYFVNIRPYISYVVKSLNQFMVETRRVHWTTTKHVLRYLHGTFEYGMTYAQGDGVIFVEIIQKICISMDSIRSCDLLKQYIESFYKSITENKHNCQSQQVKKEANKITTQIFSWRKITAQNPSIFYCIFTKES